MSDPATDWMQVRLRCDAAAADALSEVMSALGALSVTYTDAGDHPILEPGPEEVRLWPSTELTGLWPQGTDPAPLLSRLRAIVGDHVPLAAVPLGDRDWLRAWMDSFHPMRFGSRLWICPSHQEIDPTGKVVVRLDPGLAFGTGTHPTTALCLGYLDSLGDLRGMSVLDYGCGSGILGIAAALMGASRATLCDIDPQALQASGENARRNGVQGRLDITLAPPRAGGHDLTLANILLGPLAQLEPTLAALTREGGRIALSGILEDQAGEICSAYQRHFRIEGVDTREGWALIRGIRNGEKAL
ncbi:MAG: 50S ribosomal protein L11 methyltransferase [Succinivibrionaceae bacterium]|nr:50S ribosomal protein L11 methyltransferase [Succinivibrionaceae bacterium]